MQKVKFFGNRIMFLIALFLVFVSGGCGNTKKSGVSQPVISIRTSYIGLSAADVEQYLTVPIEKSISNLQLKYYSVSKAEESTITIDVVGDPSKTLADVQAVLTTTDLPQGVIQEVTYAATAQPTVLRYTLYCPSCTPEELRRWHETKIVSAFSTLPVVKAVYTVGGSDEGISVQADIFKMQSYGIGLVDLSNSLDELSYGFGTKISTIEELAHTVLKTQGGKSVWLKDIATLQLNTVPAKSMVTETGNDNVVEGVVVCTKKLSESEIENTWNALLAKAKEQSLLGSVKLIPVQTDLVLKIRPGQSADLKQIKDIIAGIGQVTYSLPGVQKELFETGFNLPGMEAENNNTITCYITLKDPAQTAETTKAIRNKLNSFPGIRYYFEYPQQENEWPATCALKVSMDDRVEAAEVVVKLNKLLDNKKGITNQRMKGAAYGSEIKYIIDRQKLLQQGVLLADVEKLISLTSKGKTWKMPVQKVVETMPLHLELAKPVDMNTAKVYTEDQSYSLAELVTVKEENTQQQILRQNGKRYVQLDFTVEDETSFEELQQLINSTAAGIDLPKGCTVTLEIE